MIDLYNSETNQLVGSTTDAELQLLIDSFSRRWRFRGGDATLQNSSSGRPMKRRN